MRKTLITISAILFTITLLSDAVFANMKALRGHTVAVRISDDYGRNFKMYYPMNTDYEYRNAGGVNIHRRYLQAENGERYNVGIKNMTDSRMGVVIAVDGRNIISGKKSYLKRNERMYIVDPYEATNYKGWRTGRNIINRFFFTDAGDSYAHAWRDDTAMGVIAIALYKEIPPFKHKKRRKKKIGPESMMSGHDRSPGTGFGEEEYSPSKVVPFQPQKRPMEKFFIKYEWRDTLCNRGIINCRPTGINHNRFWSDSNGNWDSDNDYTPYPPDHPFQRRFHRDAFPEPKKRNPNKHWWGRE